MRIVHLHELHAAGASSIPVLMEEAGRKRNALRPDLTVITGGISDPVLEWYAGRHGIGGETGELLFVPGRGDNRRRFESSFGRRYRIDSAVYGRLDRIVTIGGLSLLLVDTVDGVPGTEQLLWIRSVVDEFFDGAVRGVTTPLMLLFSHLPLDSGHSSADHGSSRMFREIAEKARSKGVTLLVFSGGDDDSDRREMEGMATYSLSPFHSTKAVRLIDISMKGTIATEIV